MTTEMRIGVVIPAAGASTRYAAGGELARSKLDEDLGGRPVLQRAIELFNTHPLVSSIVVAGPHDDEAFAAFQLRHADKLAILGVTLCRGGRTHRYETVAAALAHVPEGCTHIAVHDAARPVTPGALIERVFDAAAQFDAVVPAVPVPDTLKRASDADVEMAGDPLDAILGAGGRANSGAREVAETVDRAGLFAVQTPQVFKAELLRRAYTQENLDSTDDAQLVERLGERVVLVEGDPRNVKITTPTDLVIARAVGGFKGPTDKPAHLRF